MIEHGVEWGKKNLGVLYRVEAPACSDVMRQVRQGVAGRHLSERLQVELGGTWMVEYWPEPIHPPGLRLRPGASD